MYKIIMLIAQGIPPRPLGGVSVKQWWGGNWEAILKLNASIARKL